MTHPFGDLLSQHLHRKHGLSQARLAAGILQDPTIIGKMCKGERLTGPQARERVVAIIGWLRAQAVLETAMKANALLVAAGMAPLHEREPAERKLLLALRSEQNTPISSAGTATRRTNLPAPLTSLVGRTQELAQVAQSLTEHRLVTLIGAGGIGKTRMAIELARRLVDRDDSHQRSFPDGVWFVALEAVDAPERMASAIADAVQCPPPGAADVHDHLLSYLHTRQLLLVLDNFEHLRDWADLLTEILTAAPQAKLLVTSREALNLEEEWRYPLNGLPLEPDDDTDEAAQPSAPGASTRPSILPPSVMPLSAFAAWSP